MTSIGNWLSYRQMNEEQTKAAIPLFCRDGVAHWYQALADDKRDTLPPLKTAFKERYQAQERDKWKRAAELFNLHQTTNQTVADFLTNIEMLAKKAGLGDAQTVFAAVNGLTPVLRQAVLTKEVNTVETVRKWATIAEGAVDSNQATDITAMVADIQQTLTLLSVATSEQRPLQRQRSQSPAPRVRFDDNNHNRRNSTPDTNRSRPQGS